MHNEDQKKFRLVQGQAPTKIFQNYIILLRLRFLLSFDQILSQCLFKFFAPNSDFLPKKDVAHVI